MKERYEVKISRYVGAEEVETLYWHPKDLDDIVENIEKSIERMRPVEVSEEISKEVEEMFSKLDGSIVKGKNLTDNENKEIIEKEEKHTTKELHQKIINYLFDLKYYSEIDIELLRMILLEK